MSAENIEYTTRSLAVKGRDADSTSAWTAQVLAQRTVDEAEFFAAVAAKSRQSVADVSYIFSTAGVVLREFLRQGCHVNLSDVGFSIALSGKFPSADAAPDVSRNDVKVCAHATRSLKGALKLSELNFVNTTSPLVAHIFSVMDSTLKQDGVVVDAAAVLVTGEGLLVDRSAADEGVRILDSAGAEVAVGTILSNTAATLDCSFSALPPPGAYRLEVRARNGASPSLAPAVVRKVFEVK